MAPKIYKESEAAARHRLDLEVRKMQLVNQFRLVYVLFGLVLILNGLPIVGSWYRRIPDSIANSIAQASLLITGSAGSAVAFLIGGNSSYEGEKRQPTGEIEYGEDIEPS